MWWEKLFPEHHLLYENHYLYENRGCDAVSDSEKSTFRLTFIFVHSHARTHAHSHRGKTVLIGVLKPFKIGCWSNRAHSCSRSCWWCIVNYFTCSKYQETLRFENRHINCVFHCSVAHRTAVEMQASPSQAAKIECFRTLLPYLFLSFTRSIRNPSFHFGWNRESEIRIMAACKPYSNDG